MTITKWTIAGIVTVFAMMLFACSLPTLSSAAHGTQQSTSNSATSGGSTGSSGQPTLSVDSSRNIGVLVTPGGKRLDIQATTSDGTLVACASPVALTQLHSSSGNSGNDGSPASLIVGTTSDGQPGAWIYASDKKIVAPYNDNDGKASPVLPESGDHHGELNAHFGWSYTMVGPVGNIIVGLAVNKKGIDHGPLQIAPGTTVGVYWRIWRDGEHHDHYFISRARIIGTFDATKASKKREDWGHHSFFFGLFHRGLRLLQLFLLDQYTSYLTSVDASKMSYDATTNVYTIYGNDQNGTYSEATIDSHGVITIAQATAPPTPPAQNQIDLAGAYIGYAAGTPAGTNVTEGGSLNVAFTVNNLTSTAVNASGYSVAFYMASSSTFSASSDLALTPVSAPLPNIGANGIATINATLTMPSGSSATAYLNQCDYVYAVVTATGDTNTANDTTPTAKSLVVFFVASTPPVSYANLEVETYSPDGGTYTSNPLIAIYDSTGANKGKEVSSMGYGIATPTSPLAPGTYYVAVLNNGAGPYALDVHTTNVSAQSFTSTSPVVTTNSNDVAPQLVYSQLNENLTTAGLAPPSSGAQVLTVGTAVNFYGPNGNTDWFTFTLP